ncbi:MAG TPA: hypothetical protein VFE47_32120 [Tepidisphaeraceae bacterium]|jgi:hypothetical protein|nr:hypothetical protein [Tepidisphaeraceae bacterium]
MTSLNALGLVSRRRSLQPNSGVEYVMIQRPLHRLLAFRGRSIHDVVNSPIVKNEMLGYWKVYRQIERRTEMLELERQWNSLGQRV